MLYDYIPTSISNTSTKLTDYAGPNLLSNGAVDYRPEYTNSIFVRDDLVLEFEGGYKIQGSDLKVCIKLLHKLAKEEYPEEFI